MLSPLRRADNWLVDTVDESPVHNGLSSFGVVSGDGAGGSAWERWPGRGEVVPVPTSPMPGC